MSAASVRASRETRWRRTSRSPRPFSRRRPAWTGPPAQAATARVATQGDDIVPVAGARRRNRLAEALGPWIGPCRRTTWPPWRAVPKAAAVGERYPAVMMHTLDSENG